MEQVDRRECEGRFYANRAALPIMIDQGSGTIITVGSGAAP